MLSFLDSIFFDLNFHAHFLLFFCLTDLILVFEILTKFTIANDYSALYHAFLEKSFVCSVFHYIFVSLFEISVKSISMSCYLILCNISGKDFLFSFLNFNTEMQISLMFVYYE